jgi:histidinol-phosphate/aromatic aminotransferase/cobyric acid decarboxylase-like protein
MKLKKPSLSTLKLFILCSPNNPTGNQFEPSTIRRIVEEFKGIVLVDEAYVEFAPSSIKEMVKEFDADRSDYSYKDIWIIPDMYQVSQQGEGDDGYG